MFQPLFSYGFTSRSPEVSWRDRYCADRSFGPNCGTERQKYCFTPQIAGQTAKFWTNFHCRKVQFLAHTRSGAGPSRKMSFVSNATACVCLEISFNGMANVQLLPEKNKCCKTLAISLDGVNPSDQSEVPKVTARSVRLS